MIDESSYVVEVQKIEAGLVLSPTGNHQFAEQILRHLKERELLPPVMLLLAKYGREDLDCESALAKLFVAMPDECMAVLRRLSPIDRWLVTAVALRSLGPVPKHVADAEDDLLNLMRRTLKDRGVPADAIPAIPERGWWY